MEKDQIVLAMGSAAPGILLLTMTGWKMDGRELNKKICEQMEDDGFIQEYEWVHHHMGLTFQLTAKGIQHFQTLNKIQP